VRVSALRREEERRRGSKGSAREAARPWHRPIPSGERWRRTAAVVTMGEAEEAATLRGIVV